MEPLQADDPRQLGAWRLRGRLGMGGMGTVFLAEGADGRPVALKLLHPWLLSDEAARARFRREAQLLGRVGGMCTAGVIDVDVDGKRPYLVCEYVAGPTLEQWVTTEGPLTGEALHGFALGLAEALTAIHRAGVVHRDLTASNVLLSDAGPKVVDFGIARHADVSGVTGTGVAIGTPRWMAPEQARGQEPTFATDVFAWGALVAYAASAVSPFGEGPAEALLYRIVHEAPTLPALPPPLSQLVAAALAKDSAVRPAASDLVDRLLSSAGDETVALALERTWTVPVQHADLTTPIAPRPRPWRRLAAVAAVVLGITGATGLGWWRAEQVEPVDRSAAQAEPGVPATPTPVPAATSTPTPEPAPAATASAKDASAEPPPEQPAPDVGAPPRTEHRLLNPWEGTDLRDDITVDRELTGECWDGSHALAAREDAWRCMTDDSEILDPCFSGVGDFGVVACVGAARSWDEHVSLLQLTAPLPYELANTGGSDPALPWGLELADGQRCSLLGGATTTLAGMRHNYACEAGAVYGENQGSADAWSVFFQPDGSSEITETGVAVIWR